MESILNNPIVRSIFGEDMSNVLDYAFNTLEWAEDEIKKACERHGEDPADHGKVWGTLSLCPPMSDLPMSEALFRKHVSELCDRVAADQDTTQPTGAEILMALSQLCEARDYDPAVAIVMGRRFMEMFPDETIAEGMKGVVEHVASETPESFDEIENALRPVLVQEWRKL